MNQVPLGEIATINPRVPRSVLDKPETPVSFIAMSSVSEEGRVAFEEERELGEVAKGYTYFERGDVLLAKITPCMENGKAAYLEALSHPIGFGSTEFHVLRPGPDVDGRYLFYCIWNPRFRFIAERNMTGSAGQKRVPSDFLARYTVPLPPLREQKRLAAILDKADAIRRKRQQVIALTEDLLRSTFLEMFGDPATNPRGWEVKSIKTLAVVTTGNTPPRSRPELYGGTLEWIKSDNINTPSHYLTRAEETLSDLGREQARIVGPGATLITCIAGSADCIGNSAMTDREVAFNQQINALTPHEGVDPKFLYVQVLVGKRLVQAASTKSMKGLVSKSRLEAVQLMNPPKELQEKFGRWCCSWDRFARRTHEGLSIQDELIGSLSERAFQGQL